MDGFRDSREQGEMDMYGLVSRRVFKAVVRDLGEMDRMREAKRLRRLEEAERWAREEREEAEREEQERQRKEEEESMRLARELEEGSYAWRSLRATRAAPDRGKPPAHAVKKSAVEVR